MNELSKLIYLADLTSSVASTMVALMVVSVVMIGVSGIALAVTYDNAGYGDDTQSIKAAGVKTFKGRFALCGAAFGLCLITFTVAPSKDTVYAIAASQMGEKFVKSDTANKALSALNAWLDKQIAAAKQ